MRIYAFIATLNYIYAQWIKIMTKNDTACYKHVTTTWPVFYLCIPYIYIYRRCSEKNCVFFWAAIGRSENGQTIGVTLQSQYALWTLKSLSAICRRGMGCSGLETNTIFPNTLCSMCTSRPSISQTLPDQPANYLLIKTDQIILVNQSTSLPRQTEA